MAIFTLNHDTLIEQSFSKTDVVFADGFYPSFGTEVRFWNPTLLDVDVDKVRVFKLHGSVDWFWASRDEGQQCIERLVAVRDGVDLYGIQDEYGHPLTVREKRPVLLIATINKMLQYVSRVYVEFFCRFHSGINESSALIVSGYSFGDKGINWRIRDWLQQNVQRKIIVIDPRVNELGKLPGWRDWKSQGKLIEFPNGMESISWKNVKTLL